MRFGLGWAGRRIDDGSFTHQAAIHVEWCTASAYAWCTSAFVDGYSKSVVAGKILKKHCTKLHFYMINGCYLVKQTRHLDGWLPARALEGMFAQKLLIKWLSRGGVGSSDRAVRDDCCWESRRTAALSSVVWGGFQKLTKLYFLEVEDRLCFGSKKWEIQIKCPNQSIEARDIHQYTLHWRWRPMKSYLKYKD